jgi:Signal transduction histidine kinase
MRFGLQLEPYATLMIIAGIVSLLLASRAWFGTKREISWSFALYQTAIFVWCVFRLIQWEIPVPEIQLEALKLQYLGIAFIPAFLFMFARALAKRPAKGIDIALILLPGTLFLLAIASNQWHRLFWIGNPLDALPLDPEGGPIFWLFVGYAYVHVIIAIVMMGRVAIKARGVFRDWLWMFISLFALPFFTNTVFVFFLLRKTAYDPTPAVFAVTGLLQALAIRHFDPFDAIPYAKNVILESIDTPLIVVDLQGIIAGSNDEAKALVPSGWELEHLDISAVVHELATPLGDRETMEWRHGDVDYLISCYIVRRGGQKWRGRIYLFREISQIVKARRELEEARARADAANEAKSAFVATVSHELRNPLNAIIGLTELNLHANPPPEIREDLEVMLSSGNILLGLVNDLLDLSKIEAGKMELESIDFDLHEKAVSVLRAFRPAAEKKGIFLDLIIEDRTPRYVKGDPLRYGQVLMNLVSNAVKFTERGAVTVDIALSQAPSAEGGDPRSLTIVSSIRDTGMGIAKDKLPLLFREFSQADPSVTRRFGGTGLGLSICKNLVALFGGEIEVSSEEGAGSVFSFSARFEPGERTKAKQEKIQELAGPGKLRILIVDDDPINNAVAKRYIERLGNETVCVTTGKSAVQAASDEHFDLALLDLGLGDMDGYEACRRIRMATSSRADGELPVAAMTARMETGVRAACAQAGMIDCLAKPLEGAALDQLLDRIAEKVRQLGPRAAATVQPPSAFAAAGAKPPSPEAPGTPLINVPALLERLDNDEAFMRELLAIFVSEAPGRRANFDAASEARDLEALQKQGHALKGSSLSLCANPLGTAAGALEAACIAARRSGFAMEEAYAQVTKPLGEVEAFLESTVVAVQAVLDHQQS